MIEIAKWPDWKIQSLLLDESDLRLAKKIEEIEKQIIKSVFANISNLIEMCEYYKTKLIN